jgi:hypothetical protein
MPDREMTEQRYSKVAEKAMVSLVDSLENSVDGLEIAGSDLEYSVCALYNAERSVGDVLIWCCIL